MITRVWHGWTRTDESGVYHDHYRDDVVPTLRTIPGFRGARLLRRTVGEETEFVSVTMFEDLDAIRGFAGDDFQTAVVSDVARGVLVRFDDTVAHYETAVET